MFYTRNPNGFFLKCCFIRATSLLKIMHSNFRFKPKLLNSACGDFRIWLMSIFESHTLGSSSERIKLFPGLLTYYVARNFQEMSLPLMAHLKQKQAKIMHGCCITFPCLSFRQQNWDVYRNIFNSSLCFFSYCARIQVSPKHGAYVSCSTQHSSQLSILPTRQWLLTEGIMFISQEYNIVSGAKLGLHSMFVE